jgi:WS/DGAT/MGAT family acyltransferase
MTLCAAALRCWLQDHDALPDVPLVAAVPVSVRTEQQKNTHGNRVSIMLAPLATDVAEPLERLQVCRQAMRAAKEQFDALPADLLSDVNQFLMPLLANQAHRLAARLRLLERVNPFNLIISNVPGPDIQVYLAGTRFEAIYPLSALADGQGLNITVMSIGGRLNFGVIADPDLVPDVDVIAEAIPAELDKLLANA